MPLRIRLLRMGDEPILVTLAAEDEDFDLGEDGSSQTPVGGEDAAAYLTDPTVLHWVAENEGRVIGHLLGYVQRRRAGPPRQLLLYEIGVRKGDRRRGVGKALIGAMREWMQDEGIPEAWVLADNAGAEAFYVACGFVRDDVQPTQMTLRA